MEYELQKAEKEDLKEIVALYKEVITNMIRNNLFQWDDLYPNEELLTEDIELGELYLLRREDQIISCVVLNEEQDEEYLTGNWSFTNGKFIVIHRLCVHPNVQGEGLGKKMVQLAENLARTKGYTIVRLDAFSQNIKARHLYESLGYTYAGEVTFRKGQFYLLEKEL
jgi:ribosomal protein S18 acetylase RimI-like enzyme